MHFTNLCRMSSKSTLSERLTYYAVILFGLIAIALLSSCGTNKEMRRANRASKKLDKLVARFPELMQQDTIRDTVLFTVPETRFDTVVLKADTIEVEKDRWRVRVITQRDSVYISGGCDTVTVHVPVEIPVDTIQPIKYKPMPLKWWQIALMCLGGFFVLQQILNTIVGRLP